MGCLAAFNAVPCIHTTNTVAQVRANDPKQSLQLTTSIIKLKYCAGDADLDSLRLDLRLNFTNVGQQNLILYKGSNLVSQLMVSQNLKGIADKRFEVNASLTQITDTSAEKVKGSTPNKLFVILPPRASYITEATISIFVFKGDASGVTGAVAAGEHILQVEVPTWTASNDLAKELRSLWQKFGCLWYEPVTSVPMTFKIEKDRVIVDCP
jgi:hypothetical protein